MKFLEDIPVGEGVEIGSYLFTAENIKAFASRFDPQPFHMDEKAAAQTHFGGLCASGWHTASVWMRLTIDHRRREVEEQQARGEAIAKSGPSPGFRDMKWLKPVYAGDTVTYRNEIIDKRASASKPGWGLITSQITGRNQHGDLVFSFISTAFLQRRPA
ncbi:MAG: MaoC family dehydratase [Pseudorhodoplanes sp.]